jgi:hypothetical protein
MAPTEPFHAIFILMSQNWSAAAGVVMTALGRRLMNWLILIVLLGVLLWTLLPPRDVER